MCTNANTDTDSVYDICPANWHLPSRDEAYSISGDIGYNDDRVATARAFEYTVAGLYRDGQRVSTSDAYYWTSYSEYADGGALHTSSWGGRTILQNGNYDRDEGLSVRCVLYR